MAIADSDVPGVERDSAGAAGGCPCPSARRRRGTQVPRRRVGAANSDGYWARASDYNLYLDERGRFHVIPHDVNEGLTDGSSSRGGPPPGMRRGMPPAGGPAMFGRGPAPVDVREDPVVGIEIPASVAFEAARDSSTSARYLSYVREIAERWLDWQTLEPVARSRRALIADAVRADTRKLYTFQAFEVGCQRGEREPKKFCYSQACLPATGEVSCKQSSNAGSA